MKFALNYKKIMIVALLTLLAVISITKIAPAAADPANHKHSIEQTEEKIASVMTLSGGAAATSATLSLLPGDMCTPLAEQYLVHYIWKNSSSVCPVIFRL